MSAVSLGSLGFSPTTELTHKLSFPAILKSWVFCASLSPDKPDPPAGTPCASDIRSSSLTLSWYGSSYDGGSAVQSYSVEIWDSVDKTWKELATCRSTSFNVQDLLPDREYKFRVRAVNVYGTSEPSQESELTAVGEKPEGRLASLHLWLEMNVHDLPCVCRNLC